MEHKKRHLAVDIDLVATVLGGELHCRGLAHQIVRLPQNPPRTHGIRKAEVAQTHHVGIKITNGLEQDYTWSLSRLTRPITRGRGGKQPKSAGKRLQYNLIRVACGKKLLVRCFDQLKMPATLFLYHQNVNQAVGQMHVWYYRFCCTRQQARQQARPRLDTFAFAPHDAYFQRVHIRLSSRTHTVDTHTQMYTNVTHTHGIGHTHAHGF